MFLVKKSVILLTNEKAHVLGGLKIAESKFFISSKY